MLSQSEEQLPEVSSVLLLFLAGHLQVVEVAEDCIQVGSGMINFLLERGTRLHQAERHPQKLEESKGRCAGYLVQRRDGSFLYIRRVHRNLMVSFWQIKSP